MALSRAAVLFAGMAVVGGCNSHHVTAYGPAPVQYEPTVDDAGAMLTDGGEGMMVPLYGPAPTEMAPPSAVPSAAPRPPASASSTDAGKGPHSAVPGATGAPHPTPAIRAIPAIPAIPATPRPPASQ